MLSRAANWSLNGRRVLDFCQRDAVCPCVSFLTTRPNAYILHRLIHDELQESGDRMRSGLHAVWSKYGKDIA